MVKVNMDVLLTAFLASMRVLLFALVGVLMNRLGFLPDDTKKNVSKIIFNILSPLLAFTAIASSLDVKLTIDSWVLIVSSLIHSFISAGLVYIMTIVLNVKKSRYTLIAAGLAGNHVGLPVVVTTGLCIGNNKIAQFYDEREECEEAAIALIVIYSIFSYFTIFAGAKYLLSLDHDEIEEKNEIELSEGRSLSPKRSVSVLTAPKVSFNWQQLIPPPVIGILIGLFLVFIPGFQSTFFSQDSEIYILTSALIVMGNSSIPFTLFLLGNALSRGPVGSLNYLHLLIVTVSRLVILPIAGIGIWVLFDQANVFSGTPLIGFVLLLQSAVPSAMGLNVLASLHGRGEAEVGTILFYQYVASIITISLWVSVFLSII